MPRTKKVSSTIPKVPDIGTEKHMSSSFSMKDHLLKLLDEEEKRALESLNKMTENQMLESEKVFIEWKKDIPVKLLNKTIIEIMNYDFENTLSSTLAVSGKSLNSTRTVSNNKHQITNSTVSGLEEQNLEKTRVVSKTRRNLRSMSASGGDEGVGATSSTRQSRSRTKTAKQSVSRSLSRNVKTPVNRCPLPSTGSITPKCKTNVPLMWGRRPRVGEVGWSNQGSPLLLTGVLAPEQTATINIPIGNGDLVSLQPTAHTLKPSDLPHIEDDTKKELLILRDTLIKVCATMSHK
ncbi:uncharacterized protein LOC126743212 isoform X2 [Anthonomus grandis grandis]|uniref:uncharacterized protein LOC126743212 isoform X2 n=1 Tax=Anthonomus grandis grandis TaxID=2921223 RepID=UPI0021667103|nr:uncharacterized protein LOC126743212 isoform X2 [Anthonomus grandis grandis]